MVYLRRQFICAFLALVAVSQTLAADLYVSTTGSGGGPCASAAPCPDIATALAVAANGDSILLEAGTYSGAGNTGFILSGRTLRIAASTAGTRPVIDLNGSGTNFFSASTSSLTIEDISIWNGASGAVEFMAAALPADQITFRNVIFQNNSRPLDAGGAVRILATDGTFTFENCAFNDNSAIAGGAIYSPNVPLRMVVFNSTFSGNNATGVGGAISVFVSHPSSTLQITECTFTNNRAPEGGALAALSANPDDAPLGDFRISHSRFIGNVAFVRGGASIIYTSARTTVADTTFTMNQAPTGGALSLPLASNLEKALIQRCEFTQNVAIGTGITSNGGAIAAANPVDIRNSRFTSNVAARSAGAIFAQADVVLFDSALSSNVAALSGGALYLDTAAVPTVERNLFQMNNATSGNGGAVFSAALQLTLSANDFSGNRAVSGSGAAVYNEVGSLSLVGGSFEANMALSGVGAVYSAGVTSVSGATFSSNHAGSAGALACVSATPGSSAFALTINGATFDGNVAITGDAGAVDAGVCVTTVANSKFTHNVARGDGASVYIDDAASISITSSQFNDNEAEGNGAVYANSVTTIVLSSVSGANNVAFGPGAMLTVNGSTTSLELRSVSGSGGASADIFVDPSASAAVSVVDSVAPGSLEVGAGTVIVSSASRVQFAGLHLLNEASLVTNTDLNVTSSFQWGNGSISAAAGRTGAVSLTVGPSATATLHRADLAQRSTRSLRGIHLFNYGTMSIGYVANPNGNGSFPSTAPREVPCLTVMNGSVVVLYNSSRTTLGYNCVLAAVDSAPSRLNVSGVFDVDGSVVLEVGLTIFNRSEATTFFHVRRLLVAGTEDDFDNIQIRGRNDSFLGGKLSIRNEGGYSPSKELIHTVTIIKAPYILGNFTEQNVTLNVGATKTDEPYGLVRHTLLDAQLVVDERNRPDPNSGNIVVIVVSVILAVIAALVLALYARTIYKALCKKKEEDEDDEESNSSDEEQPLTKKNEDAKAREEAAMAAVDAAEKKSKKDKKSTNEVELNEIDGEESAPTRKKKSGKSKEKQSAEPTPEKAATPKSEKSKRKKQEAEEKPEEQPEEKPKKGSKAAKAEASEDVSSSDDASESEEKPLKKKSSKTDATEEKPKEKSKKKAEENSDE